MRKVEGIGFKANGEEEEPESFRGALDVIQHLRADIKRLKSDRAALQAVLRSEAALTVGYRDQCSKWAPLIGTLRDVDRQRIPRELADMVAAYEKKVGYER